MTHLGLNSLAAAAAKGFQVIGFHPNRTLVESLRAHRLPINEPGLEETLAQHQQRIRFDSDPAALETCDIIYIAADVPTDNSGASDLVPIRQLIDQVRLCMGPDTILVILCQVPPGFTRSLNLAHNRLYYQVETLIFGHAVERALRPERFIVGCASPQSNLPAKFASYLSAFDCPVLAMRYESAELAKISINMCLVASVGVANTMAELCEQTGADWAEIVPSLKLDRRIGPYSYLNPGLGIAGGNLERDLATVIALAEKHKTDAGIVAAWVANSRYRKEWAWRTLQSRVLSEKPDARIAVLGLAYKEDTDSTKNSPALSLLAHLNGMDVVVFDPVVSPQDARVSFPTTKDAKEAISNADVVCVMTPWAEFKRLSATDFSNRMKGRWLIDPYRVISRKSAEEAGLCYLTLGVGTVTNHA
ncbi:MAG: nucleotide sugar dehydrogenase [Sterolibacteriaceae bacterium MAG5]|nr:nucleotide sugar dehydrogenase [Candidatus Nitricoxidireducens bremensis]